ncbi:MAG TPA: hypothetical protein VJ741_18965 [Solirubrobacteraceae bacterium]|nr:hypothetical protein [Solirubrobacteraceae bacterium]
MNASATELFGDPDDDGRAVEAIAEGLAELGCTLGGEGGHHRLRRLVTAWGVVGRGRGTRGHEQVGV